MPIITWLVNLKKQIGLQGGISQLCHDPVKIMSFSFLNIRAIDLLKDKNINFSMLWR